MTQLTLTIADNSNSVNFCLMTL